MRKKLWKVMNMNKLSYMLILVHIIICIIIVILNKINIIKSPTLKIPILFFVPLLGLLMLIIDEYFYRKNLSGLKKLDIDNLKIKDEYYKSIRINQGKNDDVTVPLEEAMLINDSSISRALMLDIIHNDSDSFIPLLQKIRMKDDTEITHYSTTTLAELQGDYERRINTLASRQLNYELLVELIILLEEYIHSGLLSENVLLINRKKLSSYLEKAISLNNNKWDKKKLIIYIENKIALNEYADIEKLIDLSMTKWGNDERIFMLRFKYYWKQRNEKEMKRTLKIIEESDLYLSKSAKQWYKFWSDINYES